MEKILEIIETSQRVKNYDYDGFLVKTSSQEIFLGIENGQSCCESWGYFWSNDKPEDFVGAELLGISITDTALKNQKLIDNHLGEDGYGFEGGIMFVNLETSKGLLQFTAYNGHNGYYGHAAIVQSVQLEHEESL